jgi:riboflavin biosynthesis pyrimidine reductase
MRMSSTDRVSTQWTTPFNLCMTVKVAHRRPVQRPCDNAAVMPSPLRARLVLPAPERDVTITDAYAPLTDIPTNRPWVTMSMVASIDGAISVAEQSGGLGCPHDQAIFSALRARSDVLFVGAGTVRAEHYRPIKRVGQRLAIVTRSGVLPFEEPVYGHEQTVLVAPTSAPDMPGNVERYGEHDVDLAAALLGLGGRHVLAEGGSHLNGQLIALGLVDEICVTLSPHLVAGKAPRLATNSSEVFTHFILLQVLEADGFLFLRYRR